MTLPFLALLVGSPAVGGLLEIDFEGDLGWTGADSFLGSTATEGVAPNDASFFDFVGTDVITESGVWIEDAARAYQGDRMFWLRPYNDPDTICVGGRVSAAVEGTEIEYKFNFAAFDPTQPGGDPNTFSKPEIEVMSWDGTDWVITTPVINFSDGQITDLSNSLVAEYEVGDWDDLAWHEATTTITVPDLNGQPLYLWASMTNDSNGMLLDNIRIAQTPEPGSLFMLAFLAGPLLQHRRRR
ncbi:MAG: hypothetical protein AB8G99_04895 [Planctomycetaceae bacterium]